ncbi:hypothetical protein ACSTDW_22695, partial [Vibrio vulnificus]|uniref:hypothetical protein n=1 Tax=Vibrio vulnificus TaxID=672 RepID=UPI003ED8F8DB
NKEAVASSIWLLFFLLECDSKLTHYHPNWLNFNSDNYPARGGHSPLNAALCVFPEFIFLNQKVKIRIAENVSSGLLV